MFKTFRGLWLFVVCLPFAMVGIIFLAFGGFLAYGAAAGKETLEFFLGEF